MHYVRYLKVPKVLVRANNTILTAVVTITTDLGETFYPHDATLVARLCSAESNEDVYLSKTIQWTSGMRALPLCFDVSRSPVEWPARVHVGEQYCKINEHFSRWDHLRTVSVWSESLVPTEGSFEASRRVERRFISLSGHHIAILEDSANSIARHLWDGSIALTALIDRTVSLQTASPIPPLKNVLLSATYSRLNVLELGCGCGIVGISLAQMIPDTDVLLTDLPEVTELVESNIGRANIAVCSKLAFTPLDWEEGLPPPVQNRTNGLIIVSECTYNTNTLQPLVSTLSALTKCSPKAMIVLATKTRHDSEAAFFDMMEKAGFIEDSTARLPLPGEPGQGYGDGATDVGLHVYYSRERRMSLAPGQRSRSDVNEE